MNSELKIGDLVVLKSCKLREYNGKISAYPVMTVDGITHDKHLRCVWYNKYNGSADFGKFSYYDFSPDALEKWNDAL